jgi:quercetin dioxygenase-like cupin family protein
MNSANLAGMVRGWFVGEFTPSAFNTDACEVAVKDYKAGETEEAHYHKIATEVTLVISGEVAMSGKTWGPGDIIVLVPGDITAFEALTDAKTVCVKIPGALNDKYVANPLAEE